MSWSVDLDKCEWRGITFEVESINDKLGRKRASYEYPYRNGTLHEDMGRAPRPTSFTAVFMGPTYLTDLGHLQREVDTGKSGLFVHPLLGNWEAYIDITIEHTKDQRDMCIVSVEVIETGLDTELEPTASIDALDANITIQITALETELEDLPEIDGYDTVTKNAEDLISSAEDLQDTVTDNVAAIDQTMQKTRQSARDLITNVKRLYPDNIARGITKRAQYLAESCRQIARAAKSDKPEMRKHQQQVEGGLHLVVFSETGSADNLDEVVKLNKIRNPNRIKPGNTVTVFEEEQ